MSIWVVNRAPVLIAVVLVFKRVDVGDMWSRGETLEQGVVPILAVQAECYDFCPLNHIFCLSSIFLFFPSLFGFSCFLIDGNRLFKSHKSERSPIKD